VARSVRSFFANPGNREVLERLRKSGVEPENPLFEEGEKELPLQGTSFVFTGSLERWTREEAGRIVEGLGGKATGSVSSKTDYLVAGPGAGSKLNQARQKGIAVLDEEAFARLIGESGS
jgi:DNA ligase (NAD+)